MPRKGARLKTSAPQKNHVDVPSKDAHAKLKTDKPSNPVLSAVDMPVTVPPNPQAESREQKWRERGKLVIEFLTLAAVISYGVVAYRQWCAMLIANGQTQQALMIGQSAYVFVSDVTHDPLVMGHAPTGTVQFVNTGNLPALNFVYGGTFLVQKDEPNIVETAYRLGKGEFDMPPNLSNFADQPPQPIVGSTVISDDDYRAFMNGDERLYMVGDYGYHTGFQNPDGSPQVIARPFCRWWTKTDNGTQSHRCSVLNTEFNFPPPTPQQQR